MKKPRTLSGAEIREAFGFDPGQLVPGSASFVLSDCPAPIGVANAVRHPGPFLAVREDDGKAERPPVVAQPNYLGSYSKVTKRFHVFAALDGREDGEEPGAQEEEPAEAEEAPAEGEPEDPAEEEPRSHRRHRAKPERDG